MWLWSECRCVVVWCEGDELNVFAKGDKKLSMRGHRCNSVSVGVQWKVCDSMWNYELSEVWIF